MHNQHNTVTIPLDAKKRRGAVSLLKLAAGLALIGTSIVTAQDDDKTLSKDTPPAARLTVNITGLRSKTGQLIVSLYEKAEQFPFEPPVVQKFNLKDLPTADPFVVVFKDLPAGNYAVSALHDKNMDNKLDKNALGVPKEDWGMSNNPRPWRMPRFEEATFPVEGPETTISFPMNH